MIKRNLTVDSLLPTCSGRKKATRRRRARRASPAAAHEPPSCFFCPLVARRRQPLFTQHTRETRTKKTEAERRAPSCREKRGVWSAKMRARVKHVSGT